MAVNVNTVYTTVLYILNKEQRGYVTPTEFNSVATQVQLEIFNSYFPDGNQVNRQNQNNKQNDTEFFNMFKDISYKLYPFEQPLVFTLDTGFPTSTNKFVSTTVPQVFKIGEVISIYSGQPKYESITDYITVKDLNKIKRSKLTIPTKQNPVYTTSNALITPFDGTASIALPTTGSATAIANVSAGQISVGDSVTGTGIAANTFVDNFVFATNTITFNQTQTLAAGVVLDFFRSAFNDLVLDISPQPDSISVNGLKRPSNVVFGFTVGALGQYAYDTGSSVDFELDFSEQTNIITNCLKYFGIIVNDPAIIQAASQEAQQTSINEKS